MCFDLSDIDDSDTTIKSTVSASEALLKAADLIDENGFSKASAYGRTGSGQFTALGAVKKVALGNERNWLTGSDFGPEYERIDNWFFVNKGAQFYYWTSRPTASRIRVVQAMRKAATELAR